MFAQQAKCDAALDLAEGKIDKELETNIVTLLEAVKPKLAPKGFVVYTLYGQFFNEADTACDTQQWCFIDLGPVSSCLSLKTDLRKRFNDLVLKANKTIMKAIESQQKALSMQIRTVDWNSLPTALHNRYVYSELSFYIKKKHANIPPDFVKLTQVRIQKIRAIF